MVCNLFGIGRGLDDIAGDELFIADDDPDFNLACDELFIADDDSDFDPACDEPFLFIDDFLTGIFIKL